MSALSTVFKACPDPQVMLDDVWSTGQMIGADEAMPLMQFMMMPENRQGITTTILPGSGKVRNVEVVYMQRLTEDQVNTNQANPNCTQGEDQGDLSTTYTLDTSVNIQTKGFTLDAEMLENVCRDNGALFNRLFMRDMDVLRRAVASRLATQAVALTGGWSTFVASGSTPGTLNGSDQLITQTLNSDGSQYAAGWRQLENALKVSGFGDNVFITGGTTMRDFVQMSLAGCCAASGFDIGRLFQLYGKAFAHDVRVQSALGGGTYASGANEYLVVKPGALQLLNYTRSPWKEGFPPQVDMSANYFHGVVIDPMTGVPYDWTVKDDCGTVISNLTWTGKLIGLPNDMFATGDPYEGITGVVQGIVVNP